MSRFIDEHRGRFGVEPICRILGVSASAYYQRATGERSARAVGDERLLEQIEAVHAANYHCYGYRRTWLALKRAGVDVGRDRVKRLMRAHGIQGAKRRGKPWRTTIARSGGACGRRTGRPRLQRARPGSAVGGGLLSYLRCWEGSCSSRSCMDAAAARVWAGSSPATCAPTLVLDALRMALARRRAGADVALVHHSERGSQYTSIAFTQTARRSQRARVVG